MDNHKTHSGAPVEDDNTFVCTCCSHYGHHFWGSRLLKVVVALFIGLFIFWLGVRAGEFKAAFLSRFGGFRGGYQVMGGYGGRMMPRGGLVPQGGTAPTSTIQGSANLY